MKKSLVTIMTAALIAAAAVSPAFAAGSNSNSRSSGGSGGSGGSGSSVSVTYTSSSTGVVYDDGSGWHYNAGPSDSWSYNLDNSTKVTNKWLGEVKDGQTTWYHFSGSSLMQTGWYYEASTWYYMNPVSDGTKGSMKTGWQYVDGQWYYLNPVSDGTKGAMKTGWQYIDGKWYYLNPVSDGTKGAMKTGIQTIGGKKYYLYSDGSMAANTVIDGVYYGSDGAATN